MHIISGQAFGVEEDGGVVSPCVPPWRVSHFSGAPRGQAVPAGRDAGSPRCCSRPSLSPHETVFLNLRGNGSLAYGSGGGRGEDGSPLTGQIWSPVMCCCICLEFVVCCAQEGSEIA